MLANLYALRVVLNTMGVDDYGIYNVVGGVVVMFAFLNVAMTRATQRFLNFELGRNDTEQTRNVYSASLVIHGMIALLVIVIAETAGLWFFYTWLNVPVERQTAAFVVYQLSIAATVTGILLVPYKATIIAYERMTFFAWAGIVESGLMLGAVLLLPIIPFDSLIIYAFLVWTTGIVILMVHKFYCNKTFETACFRFCRDWKLYSRLVKFSGWSLFGQFANVCRLQGVNILINIFYSVTVNAAMGIAQQVNSAVFLFVSNFQTAFSPQIVKSYAAKDYDYFMRLIFQTSKASFFLLFFFVLPLYINADFVLRLWLKDVPDYAVVFTQLILLYSMIDTIASPLNMSIQATGDIKKYQLVVSCFIFTNLPLAFLFLWLGFSPIWALIIKVGLNFITLIWRIFFSSKMINLSIISFFREVILPVVIIAGISILTTIFLCGFFVDWNRLIISCIISTITIGSSIYYIGLNAQERILLKIWINKINFKVF